MEISDGHRNFFHQISCIIIKNGSSLVILAILASSAQLHFVHDYSCTNPSTSQVVKDQNLFFKKSNKEQNVSKLKKLGI